jgi:hypothetical protein
MYKSETTHRFPSLVLAAGLTVSVMIGLSALAQSQSRTTAQDSGLVSTMPSAGKIVVSDARVAPLRIDVIGYRS